MINRVNLIGRLVADPEIRYTQTGLPVVNINLAVQRNYKNSAGERDADFIRCVAWRKAAELINQYTNKGHLIAVEGALRMNKYQTKEGENRTTYEVEIENFQFLDRGGQGGGSQGGGGHSGSAPNYSNQNYNNANQPSDQHAPPDTGQFDSGDDDLPF